MDHTPSKDECEDIKEMDKQLNGLIENGKD